MNGPGILELLDGKPEAIKAMQALQAGHIGTIALTATPGDSDDAREIAGYVTALVDFGYPTPETAREYAATDGEGTAIRYGWEFLARLGELCPSLADADGEPVDDLSGKVAAVMRDMTT